MSEVIGRVESFFYNILIFFGIKLEFGVIGFFKCFEVDVRIMGYVIGGKNGDSIIIRVDSFVVFVCIGY